MYILVTDETSLQRDLKARFFVYGGVFFPAEKLSELHSLVDGIRRDNGFEATDDFKFSTASRPKQVAKEQHAAARRSVLNACQQLEVRFAAGVMLNAIAKSHPVKELLGWGANAMLGSFERFLEAGDSTGICVFDRLPFTQPYRYLNERFQTGLLLEDKTSQHLDRIHLLAYTGMGASHAGSAVDILLGFFRHCINEREPSDAARAVFPLVMSMMWHVREGDTINLRDYGLLLLPKEVKVAKYQQQYEELAQELESVLKEVN